MQHDLSGEVIFCVRPTKSTRWSITAVFFVVSDQNLKKNGHGSEKVDLTKQHKVGKGGLLVSNDLGVATEKTSV